MSLSPCNRRRDIRRARPALLVAVCDLRLTTRDWSLGGLALEVGRAAAARLKLGDEVVGTILLDADEGPDMPFTASVVRCDRVSGIAALRFCSLPGETFAMLERLLLQPQPAGAASDGPQMAEGPARGEIILQDLYKRPAVFSAEHYTARQTAEPPKGETPRRRRGPTQD